MALLPVSNLGTGQRLSTFRPTAPSVTADDYKEKTIIFWLGGGGGGGVEKFEINYL